MDKKETLHLERNNPSGKKRSGINWWGINSAERDLLRDWIGNYIGVSIVTLVRKARNLLECMNRNVVYKNHWNNSSLLSTGKTSAGALQAILGTAVWEGFIPLKEGKQQEWLIV